MVGGWWGVLRWLFGWRLVGGGFIAVCYCCCRGGCGHCVFCAAAVAVPVWCCWSDCWCSCVLDVVVVVAFVFALVTAAIVGPVVVAVSVVVVAAGVVVAGVAVVAAAVVVVAAVAVVVAVVVLTADDEPETYVPPNAFKW